MIVISQPGCSYYILGPQNFQFPLFLKAVSNLNFLYIFTIYSALNKMIDILTSFVLCFTSIYTTLTLESISLKKLHEGIRRGGSIGPLPSTFDTIHPIDLIFGTCNEFFYFQLIDFTWCRLIGFHGNHSHINDVTVAAILDFQIFRFFHIQIGH